MTFEETKRERFLDSSLSGWINGNCDGKDFDEDSSTDPTSLITDSILEYN